MNEISKQRIEQARNCIPMFSNLDIKAVVVTGSIAKGYGDENSDIDVLIAVNENLSKAQFDKIVEDAKKSGGDLYHGTPEEGFAVYYYINGIKIDFGIAHYTETETLISEMLEKPEVDLVKHLMISGLIDGYILMGNDWIEPILEKAEKDFPKELQVMVVNHFKKFHPEWAIRTMAVEREDDLFYYESLVEITENIIGILCGLNKKYHPGKLKGIEYSVDKMEIKPENFIKRYKSIFSMKKTESVIEIHKLVRETFDLIDIYLPDVSTVRSREVLEMVLRK